MFKEWFGAMWMIRRIGVVALAIPLTLIALAALAFAIGCYGDDGSGVHCIVFSTDIAGLVVTPLFVLTLFGVPPAIGIVLVWLLIEIIYFVRQRWAGTT